MKEHSPIAIFIYNRPQKIKDLLNSLKENNGFDKHKYYIFSDGPKNELDNQAVINSRILIRDFFKKINYEIICREKNIGLSKSIISGVSFVLDKHENIIVLEDDLILNKNFLIYMNSALEKYTNQTNVFSICAHMFNSKEVNSLDEFFFLKNISSWGWGTWKNRWNGFNEFLNDDIKIKFSKSEKFNFNLENSYPFYKILKKTMKGKVDSWAIKWYLFVFKNQGLSLYPNQTLILNKGFDGSGTNTILISDNEFSKNSFSLKFPKKTELNDKGFKYYKKLIKKNLNIPLHKKIYLRIISNLNK